MKITKVRLGRISVPLRTPFKTALRSVNSVEDVIVEVHTDCGAESVGEAVGGDGSTARVERGIDDEYLHEAVGWEFPA